MPDIAAIQFLLAIPTHNFLHTRLCVFFERKVCEMFILLAKKCAE